MPTQEEEYENPPLKKGFLVFPNQDAYATRGGKNREEKVVKKREKQLSDAFNKHEEITRKLYIINTLLDDGFEHAADTFFDEDKEYLMQFKGKTEEEIIKELDKVSKQFYALPPLHP